MSDEDVILAVVADLLQPGGFARAGTGALRTFGELTASMDADGFVDRDEQTEIKTLRLADIGNQDAVVELDAIRISRAIDVHGRQSSTRRLYSGPVVLVREQGEWKVVDLLVDGESMRGSVFGSSLVGRLGEVEVVVLGGRVDRGASRVFLFVEVRNGFDRVLNIGGAAVGVMSRRGNWRWRAAFFGTNELAPGITRMTVQIQLAQVDAGDAFRLVLLASEGLIDIRPDTASPLARYPVWLGFKQSWWRLRHTVWFGVLYWALYTVGFVFAFGSGFGDRLWLAGLFVCVLSVIYLRRTARMVRSLSTRRRVAWVCWLVAAAAIGLVVGVSTGAGSHLRALDRQVVTWGFVAAVMIAIAVFVAISNLRRYRRGDKKQARRRLLASLGLAIVGVVLAVTLGGLFPSQSTRSSVINFVLDGAPGARIQIVSASRALDEQRGRCHYEVWGVRSKQGGRWWVVINTNTDTFTEWYGWYNTPAQAVGYTIRNDRSYSRQGSSAIQKDLRAASC
jgi:hypothetical protein